MRLLVCGGRSYADRQTVFDALDRVHAKRPVTLLIHGGAHGADRLAFEWAASRGVLSEAYRADWGAHGRGAGPIRNRRMLTEGRPDGVVAFPGGSGTADMVAKARAAGLKVWYPVPVSAYT